MARIKKVSVEKKTAKKRETAVKPAVRKKINPSVKKKTASVKKTAVKKEKRAAKKQPVKKKTVRQTKTKSRAAEKSSAGIKSLSQTRQLVEGSSKTAPRRSGVFEQTAKKRRAAGPAKSKAVKISTSAAPANAQTPHTQAASFYQETHGVLPAGYGDHFITLMICSPHQLYSYWEIDKQRETEALQSLGGQWELVKSILRVYNLTQDQGGGFFFDIEIGGGAAQWFLSVEPAQSYRVEIGLRHADGRFVMLARSNDVTTPRVTMSEILDEEWMGIDFERMYALSGGWEPGQLSSASLQKLMSERLRWGETSGSGAGMLSSGSLVKKKNDDFWFTLNCELIVHGATAPDAQVTMNGKRVALRPDGTFSLHYALPDGKIRLEAKAVSADFVYERKITPTVRRSTERPEPVIRRNRGRG